MENVEKPEAPNHLGLAVLAFGHFCVDMQTSALAVLIPLLYVTFSLDYTSAAIIVTINSLSSSIIQPLFGLLSDRKSLQVLMPVGCLIASTAILLVTFVPSYWLVLVVVVFSGLGTASFHPEGSRNANYVSGSKKATGLSVFFVGGSLGFAFGPILITALFALFGKAGAFGMLIPAVLSSLVLWRLLPVFAAARLHQTEKKPPFDCGSSCQGPGSLHSFGPYFYYQPSFNGPDRPGNIYSTLLYKLKSKQP